MYGNRLAPSSDISQGFAILEHLCFVCSRGSLDGYRLELHSYIPVYFDFRCGDLAALYQVPAIQNFLNGTPYSTLFSQKHIHQPGPLKFAEIYFTNARFSFCFHSVTNKCPAQRYICSCSRDWKPDCTLDTRYKLSCIPLIGSLHHEMGSVGSSVQFATGPREVSSCVNGNRVFTSPTFRLTMVC